MAPLSLVAVDLSGSIQKRRILALVDRVLLAESFSTPLQSCGSQGPVQTPTHYTGISSVNE